MQCMGTLAVNRKGLPLSFKSLSGRKEGDYHVLYEVDGKISIHSWAAKNKNGKFPKSSLKNTSLKSGLGQIFVCKLWIVVQLRFC